MILGLPAGWGGWVNLSIRLGARAGAGERSEDGSGVEEDWG